MGRAEKVIARCRRIVEGVGVYSLASFLKIGSHYGLFHLRCAKRLSPLHVHVPQGPFPRHEWRRRPSSVDGVGEILVIACHLYGLAIRSISPHARRPTV